jgi:hypothetical protein
MRRRSAWALAAALAMLASIAGCGGGGGGGSDDDGSPSAVAIRWRASPDAAGYVVHWGAASRVYAASLDVGAPPVADDGSTEVVVPLDPADVYYFAVTSYDASGRSSGYSNEIAVYLR